MPIERLADKPIIDSVDETTKVIVTEETLDLDGNTQPALFRVPISALNNFLANNNSLKPIQTITLDESVASIETTFEKPLKEIYCRFIGKLNVENEVTDCYINASSSGGTQYFVWSNYLTFSPNANKAFTFHAKEMIPHYWETDFPKTTLNIADTGNMQGIDGHTADVRKSYSTRFLDNYGRYVPNLKFSVRNAKYSFAVGSTLEIYGVEVDE